MIDNETKTLIRTLRDALYAARDVVSVAECEYDERGIVDLAREASDLLDRVDAAIVEADEVLS